MYPACKIDDRLQIRQEQFFTVANARRALLADCFLEFGTATP